MIRARYPGVPAVRYARVPSWSWGSYPRFGAWRHPRGLTLRYRHHLLHIKAFGKALPNREAEDHRA